MNDICKTYKYNCGICGFFKIVAEFEIFSKNNAVFAEINAIL